MHFQPSENYEEEFLMELISHAKKTRKTSMETVYIIPRNSSWLLSKKVSSSVKESLIYIPSPFFKDSFISLNELYTLQRKADRKLLIKLSGGIVGKGSPKKVQKIIDLGGGGVTEREVEILEEECNFLAGTGAKYWVCYVPDLSPDATRNDGLKRKTEPVKASLSPEQRNLVKQKSRHFIDTVLLVDSAFLQDYVKKLSAMHEDFVLDFGSNFAEEIEDSTMGCISNEILLKLSKIYQSENFEFATNAQQLAFHAFDTILKDISPELKTLISESQGEIFERPTSILTRLFCNPNTDEQLSPLKRRTLLSSVLDSITQSFNSQESSSSPILSPKSSKSIFIGADDLLPLFVYCVVGLSSLDSFYSTFIFMRDFRLTVKEGLSHERPQLEYAMTTLEAAVHYLLHHGGIVKKSPSMPTRPVSSNLVSTEETLSARDRRSNGLIIKPRIVVNSESPLLSSKDNLVTVKSPTTATRKLSITPTSSSQIQEYESTWKRDSNPTSNIAEANPVKQNNGNFLELLKKLEDGSSSSSIHESIPGKSNR
ncbi:hypothetical protein MP638_006333 [Amoeboaphelidium occidentale]|nr:hypothetical protein MP638_006333 [Amoeboaphelidium occidentale]